MINSRIDKKKLLFLSAVVMSMFLFAYYQLNITQAAATSPTNTKVPTSTKTLSPKSLTATALLATPIPATPIPTYTDVPAPVYTPGPNDTTPQLDSSHTVSQMITYDDGGTMTLTDAQGNKYTLTFPPHSVLADTKITMTALQSVAAQSGSNSVPVLGVQLEPDGQLLWEPAALLIEPSTPIPVNQQRSFSYHANGINPHLSPLDEDAQNILFHVYHFSGYGVTGVPDFDNLSNGWKTQDVPAGQPTGKCDQDNCLATSTAMILADALDTKTEEIIKKYRNKEISHDEALKQLQDVLDQFQKDYIDPYLKDVGTVNSIAVIVSIVELEQSISEKLGAKFDALKASWNGTALEHDFLAFFEKTKESCGMGAAHRLVYDQNLGWLIDAPKAVLLEKMWHILQLLYKKKQEPLPAPLLNKCRPVGFKFSGLKLVQTAAQGGGVINLSMSIGMKTCGADPYTNPWETQGWTNHAVIQMKGMSVAKDTETTAAGGLFPRSGQVTFKALTLQLLPGNPTVLRGWSAIPGYTKAGPVDAVVEEDSSCPPLP